MLRGLLSHNASNPGNYSWASADHQLLHHYIIALTLCASWLYLASEPPGSNPYGTIARVWLNLVQFAKQKRWIGDHKRSLFLLEQSLDSSFQTKSSTAWWMVINAPKEASEKMFNIEGRCFGEEVERRTCVSTSRRKKRGKLTSGRGSTETDDTDKRRWG